ncbi:MAG: hypothetical protein OXC72_05550 [Roseovarius sp.]|nr:hypothetical protein [Roseovarius sp.]
MLAVTHAEAFSRLAENMVSLSPREKAWTRLSEEVVQSKKLMGSKWKGRPGRLKPEQPQPKKEPEIAGKIMLP